MKNTRLNILFNDFILLLTAAIWGLAFSAQRQGLEYMGPFTYNGIRFFLGFLFLVVFLSIRKHTPKKKIKTTGRITKKQMLLSCVTGSVLFFAANAQQAGLIWTSAGNAGFITTFYVILVPFFSMIFGKRIHWFQWIGAVIAIAGLFLLTNTGLNSVNPGDLLVLLSALLWTAHVLLIEKLMEDMDPVIFSAIQFLVCALLSILVAIIFEQPDFTKIMTGWFTLVYGGIFSVGIAYTLQAYAQTKVPAAHAVILLSMESVFAAVFGVILLSEFMQPIGWLGAGLVFFAVILSQTNAIFKRNNEKNNCP